jgi:Cu/Ag efflux pump CusA
MNRITIAASKELQAIPGVRNFGAHIGQAYLMDEVVGVHFGENWISLDPNVPYDETVASIQKVVDGYPGLYRDLLTYLKERIREVLSGAGESIVIRLYGPELEVLSAKAQEVREVMEAIDGTINVHVSLQKPIPQIEIEVDLARASRYGLKPGDVRRAVSYLVASEEVGDIYKNNETYDVQVWTVPAARNSLTDIEHLLIDTPDGGIVQLKDVADVRITPTPNVIQREYASRYINIEANVSGRDLAAVAEDVIHAVRQIEFPIGYRPELLGEYKELRAASQRLFLIEIAALIGTFILLQLSFASWRLAILAFAVLPIAFVGGVFAAFMGGGVLSLGSLVGFITVLGIAARNGILLLSHYQHLQAEERMEFGLDLVLRGARERLAPILMTAITTGIALLPLVWKGNIPGHEIEYPMAIVILGGLVTSTLVNLFVMPSLYLFFGRPRAEAEPAMEFAQAA